MIVAVDPGSDVSAYVLYDPHQQWLGMFGIQPNAELCDTLMSRIVAPASILVCEMLGYYGPDYKAGQSMYQTAIWIGRFLQAWSGPHELVLKSTWRAALCGTSQAADKHVIAALTDRFGPKGTKKNPGKLYGVKSHIWQALGIAVAYGDTHDVTVFDGEV